MTKEHNLQNNAIMNSIEVDNLKWNELRQTVKQYGLSTSGKKIDLQQRLKNYFVEGQQHHRREEAAAAAHEKETRPETTDAEGKAEAVEKHDDATTPGLTSEQRRRMEENRKRALEIRQMKEQKRLKSSSIETAAATIAANPITPAPAAKQQNNPYKNPYAKAGTTFTPAQYSSSSAAAGAVTVSATKIAPKKPTQTKNKPTPIPPVISAWGDCRLDLWEAACQCGGAREHSPDVRMCRCGAALDAGLVCQGCGGGVLLIKSGPRGNFWGCSNYKKRGCKFTKRFGSPHDSEAARVLAQMKQSAARKKDREREEWSRIQDRFEVEWRSECRCDGAKNLNTFECKMQSEGGCGMLPLCPQGCGGQLFLHPSKGSGKWWGCSNFRNGLCNFRANYEEHA